jgi:hypothetical protein
MKKAAEIALVLSLLLLTFSRAQAQEFPYNDFKPRKLSDVIENNVLTQKGSMQGVKSKGQIIIDGDPLPSLIRMIYTGKTKPISDERKNYLKLWIDSFGRKKEFNDVYNVEMLVGEGSNQYWLLVQKQLLPAFEKEITAGEPVDLYVIRMGGFLTDKGWDWMFIVEEFRKPGGDSSGFPWNDFERRTLEELVKRNIAEDADDLKRAPGKGQFVFRGEILSSVVRVTYTGESRKLSDERKKFIELWAGSYSQDPNYAGMFQSEFLFKEGAQEYWLPVQQQVAKFFEQELKKGDAVDLYLVRPGGLRVKDKLDWIFLVEEFQKPPAKEWPKP